MNDFLAVQAHRGILDPPQQARIGVQSLLGLLRIQVGEQGLLMHNKSEPKTDKDDSPGHDPSRDVDVTKIDKIALGPWRNEATFWVGLVEKKKLHHLGDPDPTRNALRDKLAIGHLVFARRPDPTDPAFLPFLETGIRDFMTSGRLHRIYFDITNMKTLSGSLGDGYWASFELKLIYQRAELLIITSFYQGGNYLKMKRDALKRHLADILKL